MFGTVGAVDVFGAVGAVDIIEAVGAVDVLDCCPDFSDCLFVGSSGDTVDFVVFAVVAVTIAFDYVAMISGNCFDVAIALTKGHTAFVCA